MTKTFPKLMKDTKIIDPGGPENTQLNSTLPSKHSQAIFIQTAENQRERESTQRKKKHLYRRAKKRITVELSFKNYGIQMTIE